MRLDELVYTLQNQAMKSGIQVPMDTLQVPMDTYFRFFIINEKGQKKQVFIEENNFDPKEKTFEILLR